MKKLSLLVMLGAALSFQACTSSNKQSDSVEAAKDSNENSTTMAVKEDDSEFMVNAANGGMMEVEAGKVAADKAQSKAVKDYAAMMVKDHTKAGDELKALAASKSVTLPAMLAEDEQKHLTDMSAKTGADFDKHYVDMMVDDHDKTIKMFEDEAKDGKDADAKAWAAKTLPTLKQHQDAIKAIKDKMK
jgi:putative membrane protein